MNEERCLQLADAVDFGLPNVEFSMASFAIHATGGFHIDAVIYQRNCRTICCSAGHAVAMFGELWDDFNEAIAARLLGLDDNQSQRLFYNKEDYIAPIKLNKITRQEAAAAIRRMVREEGRPMGEYCPWPIAASLRSVKPAEVEDRELVAV